MAARVTRFTDVIALPAPYDAERLFGFLASRAIPRVETTWPDAGSLHYARSLRLPGGPASILIREDDGAVRVTGLLSDPGDQEQATSAATRILDLGNDPRRVDAALSEDDTIAPLIAERPGLRVPGAADAYELVIRAIVGQQISVARASAACGVITEAHGDGLPEPLRIAPGLTGLFPTAAALAAAEPEQLRMPRARGAAIVALSEQVSTGSLDLTSGPAAMRAQLMSLRGIGPWTAGYVSMRACGDRDVLLDGDLIVRRSAESLGLPGRARDLAAYGERFAPWRSYLTMHLWAAYKPATISRVDSVP